MYGDHGDLHVLTHPFPTRRSSDLNLRVGSALLTREGYDVITAASGPDALACYADAVPDMILLDMMMPGMDGFEVLKVLREQEPPLNIPVVFVTAAHDRDRKSTRLNSSH